MSKLFAAVKDGYQFFKTMSFKKLLNYMITIMSYRLSILKGRSSHRGMPVSISIEPTTSCNLRCPECPAGLRKFTRPTGMMPIDTFQDITDQLKSRLIYLMLYFQGEPLLNPSFFNMVQYAVKNKIYTATSTNAHFLDDENARKTVASGLHRLIISIDGTTQESYEKYRVGGELKKVLAGLDNITRWKKKLSSSTPYTIVQFLVLRTNEHQIEEIRSLSRKHGANRLALKSAQVYNYEEDGALVPENSRYARYKKSTDGKWVLKKPLRNHCFRMWSGSVITWDGKVVPCCFDKDAKHQFGTLEEVRFKDIWRSQPYNDFRDQILQDRSQVDICRNCDQ